MHREVGSAVGWHLALAQLQRPGLTSKMVPGLQQESGGRAWRGTQAADISQFE